MPQRVHQHPPQEPESTRRAGEDLLGQIGQAAIDRTDRGAQMTEGRRHAPPPVQERARQAAIQQWSYTDFDSGGEPLSAPRTAPRPTNDTKHNEKHHR